MHTWKHWTGNCLTKRLSVPLPNVCQCVFPVSSHLQTRTLAVKDSGNHITAGSYFLALSSIRPVSLSPEGRGESLSVCDIVFPQSSSAFPSARVCPCAAHWLSCQMRREVLVFFCFFPVWVGWCVNVSIEHAVAALPIARRVNCYTCQRFRSHRLFAFTRCPAALRWSSFLWAYLTTSLGPHWPNTSWEG